MMFIFNYEDQVMIKIDWYSYFVDKGINSLKSGNLELSNLELLN